MDWERVSPRPVAVLTYSVDRPSYGISPTSLDSLAATGPHQENVQRRLLTGYAGWIRDNGEEISSNSTYLLASQSLLVVGLACLALGIYRLG